MPPGSVRVAGHWELGWNTPIKEAELWNLPLRDFGVHNWWMWPVSGIRHREQQVKLHERADLKEILSDNEGIPRVFFEPENPVRPHNAVSLLEFQHPQDVLYIFGSAHFDPVVQHRREQDPVVYLPTVQDSGVLWPHQVFVALMYDRMVKSWQ